MDRLMAYLSGVATGVTVTLISLYVTRFIVEPLIEQVNYRYGIRAALKYYAPLCLDPHNSTPEEREKAAVVFREYGCWIESKTLAVRHYESIARLLRKPSLDELGKASGELIGLSNFIRAGRPPVSELDTTRRDRILKYLHVN